MSRQPEHLRKDWATRAAEKLATSLGHEDVGWDSITAQVNVARLIRRAWRNGYRAARRKR